MKSLACFSYTVLLIFGFNLCFCQNDFKAKGDHAFRHGNYVLALSQYASYEKITEDSDCLVRRAVALMHQHRISEAIADLTLAKSLGNDDKDLYWHMGQCKHFINQWYEAMHFYRQYLQHSSEKDKYYNRALVEIKNCLYSTLQDRSIDKSNTLVQSFGPDVNTSYDEILAVQSPSFGNTFYYVSNQESQSFKIYSSTISETGTWQKGDLSSRAFNSLDQNYIQDIDASGTALLYLQFNEKQNKHLLSFITIDSLGKEITIPVPLESSWNARDFQIVNGHTLAFSAEMDSGLGGYDIYWWEYVDGKWHFPVNAGDAVNSAFDELGPEFNSNKSKIYFSSNRPYGYGGYDIYFSELSSTANTSSNLGSAVNSSANDICVKLDDDGHMALFSSDRKNGEGGYDLYFLYLHDLTDEQAKDSSVFQYVEDYLNNITYEPSVDLIDEEIVDSLIKYDDRQVLTFPSQLFYRDSHDVLGGNNALKLQKMAKTLIDNDYSIHILASANEWDKGLPEYLLLNTLRRAQSVADKLIELGVSPSKISLESSADHYPVIRSNVEIDSLMRFNSRIDLLIFDSSHHLVNDSSKWVWNSVPETFLDKEHQLFQQIKEGIHYSVRIASSEKMFKNAILRLYQDVFIRNEKNGYAYDYYVGLYTNIEDAKNLMTKLKDQSGIQPEIVVFKNYKLLSANEIRALAKTHNELLYFLRN